LLVALGNSGLVAAVTGEPSPISAAQATPARIRNFTLRNLYFFQAVAAFEPITLELRSGSKSG
jgi:hypothetical protein